jgi:hypothetical protein
MTKGIVRALAAVGLLGLTASSAAADGFKSWTVCGGSSFATCASVRLRVTGTKVTLGVRNLSGMNGTYGGTVFTAIGLSNVPPGINAVIPASGSVNSMSGPTRGSNTPRPWQLVNDKAVGGGIWLDLAAKNPGINNGIASNCDMGSLPGNASLFMTPSCGANGVTNGTVNRGWVVLSFDVTETWDPSATGTELMVRGQNGPGGANTVCVTGENCAATDVVPEPFTIALVGSGLAGLGLLRRRRKRDDAA